jgi:hypothetical protein
MDVATVVFCDLALTRQTMSLLLADSNAPRSVMVCSSRSG